MTPGPSAGATCELQTRLYDPIISLSSHLPPAYQLPGPIILTYPLSLFLIEFSLYFAKLYSRV